MDINIIVFSKDRACQLELFLRSMKEFFKEFNECEIKILYTFSDPEFEKGYEKLKTIHNDPNIKWDLEYPPFQEHLIHIFDKDKLLSVFFVDDNVFKEPFSFEDEEFERFKNRSDILTLSLRLHPRLNYCYPARLKQFTPNMLDGVFNWVGLPGDFGYPMSLDGNIFLTKNIKYYITRYSYNGPNSLESLMAMQPVPINLMNCYEKSRIMNLPLNKVQNYNNNVHGNISAKYLNDQFLSGKIISLENIRGFDNTSCHQEIEIKFFEY